MLSVLSVVTSLANHTRGRGDARCSLAKNQNSMNPYQSPAVHRSSRQLPWTLSSLVIVVAWGLMVVASSLAFGPHGFGLALYGVTVSWIVMTRFENSWLAPINKVRPTTIECVLVLAICGVLHGLALPSVTTNCVGRRRFAAPSVPSSLQSPMNSVDTTPPADENNP